MAAITVAQRVAQEMHCTLGKEVGYQVRFDDCTSQVRGQLLIIIPMSGAENVCCLTRGVFLGPEHGGEVHDGRLFAQRDPGRSRALSVQRGHLGRGPRTQPQHGESIGRWTNIDICSFCILS